MLPIGLTGSIATGKSTVSSLLASPPHSLPVIDADILAREVVEPGTKGYSAIVKHFGPASPDLLVEPSESMPAAGPSGKGRPLNRAALGRRIFGDGDDVKRDRAVVNGIIHPAVRWAMFRMVLRCYLRGEWAVVLDIPLLFESGLDRFCGTIMVVAVHDPAVQMQRLRDRNQHLSPEDAQNRVRSQTDVRVKARRSETCGGAVLWNDGTREGLERDLGDTMEGIRRASPRWWSWVLLACPPLVVMAAAWGMWRNEKARRRWQRMEEEDKKES